MAHTKIHPQTEDEIALCDDCDLPFAKTDHDAIVLDPRIIDHTRAIFEEADPKKKPLKPKKY